MLEQLKKELRKKANVENAKAYQRFFKTGKGEYGEGDVFLGLATGERRDIVKKYFGLALEDIQDLLESEIHEFRSSGVEILRRKYEKAKEQAEKKELVDFYLANAKRMNNWDLVDCSAPHVIGDFLLDKEKKVLYEFAKSENLWERRIAIISCFAFIRQDRFDDTFAISEILLDDEHDLIHKAVGWMLREIGKKDEEILEDFLKKNYSRIPRTALRYAIEKFEEEKRKRFLRGEF